MVLNKWKRKNKSETEKRDSQISH